VDLKQIGKDVREASVSLLETANLEEGQVIVIGCSTSEVAGGKIGTSSNIEVAETILHNLLEVTQSKGIYLAIQCCEHLNRALVVEKDLAKSKNLELVSVYPAPKAGGALGAAAMEMFHNPVVVEFIKADAGMDIGDTFIGMHLKHVAVPVRLATKQIGQAHLTLAITRPKLIGGPRAVYCKD